MAETFCVNTHRPMIAGVQPRPVQAKYLTYNGAQVCGPDDRPYIVPADFDFDRFIAKYQSIFNERSLTNSTRSLYENFRSGGQDDIQTVYNGIRATDRFGFVPDFSPAASFLYATASSILGFSESQSLLYNLRNVFTEGIDIGPVWGNNPANVPHIGAGYQFTRSIGIGNSPTIDENSMLNLGLSNLRPVLSPSGLFPTNAGTPPENYASGNGRNQGLANTLLGNAYPANATFPTQPAANAAVPEIKAGFSGDMSETPLLKPGQDSNKTIGDDYAIKNEIPSQPIAPSAFTQAFNTAYALNIDGFRDWLDNSR